MKADQLLKMIESDQKGVSELFGSDNVTIEDRLDTILNVQHTVLQGLHELLTIAKQEGKLK